MNVGELIEELKKMPQDKIVEIGTISATYGIAVRVLEYRDTVEIESDHD